MSEFEDVYGKALADFYNGDHTHELIVHSDIAEDESYPVDYFFRSEFPEIELKAMELATGKVLDVGAGVGNHSLFLQEQGCDVTALELSGRCVEVMEKRGVRKTLHADFFELKDQQFDCLLMLMNGFGIMGTIERIPDFLEKANELLALGGQVIFDSSDLIHLYREEDGSVLIDLNGAYYGEVEFQMEYKGELGEPFKWLFVASDIIDSLASDFGFKFEVLQIESDNHYLACLTKVAEPNI